MPPRSEFLRTLRQLLLADARQRSAREVDTALKVAVLLQLVPRSQLAERAGASESEVKVALATLRRIAPQLEREERPTL